MTLHIVRPGPLTTVQDLGRPGLAHLGVGSSGAADRPAHRLANRLVGNVEKAATLELTLGGLVLRTDQPAWIALTGAAAPARGDHADIPAGTPAYLPAGTMLTVGVPPRGLRTYLAVRGGIAAAEVLGSRSSDLLSGIGPAPVSAGAALEVGPAPGRWRPVVDHAPVSAMPDEPVLALTLGPREDWLTEAARAVVAEAVWAVSPDSNRVGVRLVGPVLERAIHAELPSEGMVGGAVQVPPSGAPIVFLADHPVTGGYPVLGVLTDEALAVAAQLRPGDRCRIAVRPARRSGGPGASRPGPTNLRRRPEPPAG